MLSFFKKYLKEEGVIPKAPTLQQIYFSSIFKKHVVSLKLLFDSMPISIIMNESLDNCACNVVNTIFVYYYYTKLVFIDFLNIVNNSTIGQTLFYILTNYNISFNKPILFLFDSAAYMKKCYREVLKSIMIQLIHVLYCAHILNLIKYVYLISKIAILNIIHFDHFIIYFLLT